jgi:hypothetical protein
VKIDRTLAHYRRNGFIAFAKAPMTLFLPLAQAAGAMGMKQQ